MDEKRKFRRFFAVVSAVLVLGVLIVIIEVTADVDNWWMLASAFILLSMALVMLFFIRRGLKDIESGIPLVDERSRIIDFRAGYLAFFISLFFIMGMSFVHAILEINEITSVSTSEWLMIYVGVMGANYLIIHAYMNKKGVPR